MKPKESSGQGSRGVPEPHIMNSGIPYRTLGHTGEKISVLGLGGYHIGIQKDEAESIRIIRTAIDNGINFMDNCWDYNNGVSEIRMGKALRDGYRNKVFLMTKIDAQTKTEATKQIEESIRRLQVNTIDLLQFHEVIRISDPDRILGPNGALEAALEAKKTGKIRYIGFTGHKSPDIHLKMLKMALDSGFLFDAVQMPLNVIDAHNISFEKKVLPVLLENNIGVLGMKPLCEGRILNKGIVNAVECLHYAMSLPTSVVITGCDSIQILQQALKAARSFRPMSDEQRTDLLSRTAKLVGLDDWETYKTTNRGATFSNPHFLG